jgi:potassium-dependent mechanosensitive channel
MNNLSQWFRSVFIEPSVTVAGKEIHLLNVMELVIALAVSFYLARVVRRLLDRFFSRLPLQPGRKALLLGLASATVILLGALVGLAVVGIDLTIVGHALTFSVAIGQTRFSLATLIVFVLVVAGAVILAKYLRVVLRDRVLPPFELPENAQFLLLRTVDVSIVVLGVLLALNITGLGLNSLMVVLGGLGIGIGFGLQNIASNLVSGVILLFERPIRIGDRVTVGETIGVVHAINMRSTVLVTPDNINMIVPNSQFVSETITNWTYGDRIIRIKVPVGVAYGSDTALVKETLLEVAGNHPDVLKEPNPNLPAKGQAMVRFVSFGSSSLDFELVAWIPDVQYRLSVISDLLFMIDQKFREKNLVIAFPQMDVHLDYVNQNGRPDNAVPNGAASARPI